MRKRIKNATKALPKKIKVITGKIPGFTKDLAKHGLKEKAAFKKVLILSKKAQALSVKIEELVSKFV